MPAKSQIKKRQITGRAIFRRRSLNRYYGPVSWPRTHRRVYPGARYSVPAEASWLPMVVVFVLVTVTASVWFGWRIRAGLDEFAGNQARFRVLEAENRGLKLRIKKLSDRARIEKIAASLGLFPSRSRQRIRIW